MTAQGVPVRSCFNPRPPCGGRQRLARHFPVSPEFQSAPSLRRATREVGDDPLAVAVSIRALPAEGDRLWSPRLSCGSRFQSAPSLRRATRPRRSRSGATNGFNPRPPCGGRPAQGGQTYVRPIRFNPRPPCGGRRTPIAPLMMRSLFQSAPSLRRATPGRCRGRRCPTRFNPRPPCGGRPQSMDDGDGAYRFQSAPSLRRATLNAPQVPPTVTVSIRALPAEGDHAAWARAASRVGFQSAPSLRRATISSRLRTTRFCCFNPRPPCGGRPMITARCAARGWFQSAPSLRRATHLELPLRRRLPVSIRALPAEGDR